VASRLLDRATEHVGSRPDAGAQLVHPLPVEAERGHHDRARELAELAMKIVGARELAGMPQASLAFTALAQTMPRQESWRDAVVTVEQGFARRRRNPSLAPSPRMAVTRRAAASGGA
jgi:hypothetical protein